MVWRLELQILRVLKMLVMMEIAVVHVRIRRLLLRLRLRTEVHSVQIMRADYSFFEKWTSISFSFLNENDVADVAAATVSPRLILLKIHKFLRKQLQKLYSNQIDFSNQSIFLSVNLSVRPSGQNVCQFLTCTSSTSFVLSPSLDRL